MDATTMMQILGFSVGYLYGESFSQFDQKIKYESKWYAGLSPLKQWLISSLLDTQHHFQYGLLLVLLSQILSGNVLLLTGMAWIGYGLIVSDGRDFSNVLRRMGLEPESMNLSVPLPGKAGSSEAASPPETVISPISSQSQDRDKKTNCGG